MTKKKDPPDITETPPTVTAKPNVYQDVPPTQADILAFIDNPENINKAVEGSMAKRNKVLNRKDPSEEGSGPAHMSGNSYSSSVPQAPPIQVGEGGATEQPQSGNKPHLKQVDKLSPKALDAAIREAIILALSQPMSKRVSAVESLLRAEYRQLLDEMPEKMAKRYNSRDIAVNSTGWEVGELDAYDTAIDDCRATILKKLEELQ